jgi:hypothetical protein
MNRSFHAHAATGSGPTEGFGTPGYRAYVLNFVDRGLLAVVARFAETRNRVWIMAVCLAFWSLMTAACRDRLLRHGRDARHRAREPGGRPGRRLVRPARA